MTNQQTPQHVDGDIVFVAGAPGMGKTWMIIDAMSYELRAGHRLIMLDFSRDMGRYLRRDGIQDIATVQTVAQAEAARRERVVIFELPENGGVKGRELANAWLEYVVKHHSPGTVFVCDEADLVFDAGVARGDQLAVIKLMRNWQCRLYVATQRPQYVATLLRSNATHVAIFAGESRRYVDPGCAEFGDPERFARALELPQHHYLYRARGGSGHRGELAVINARDEAAPWV